MSELIQKNDNRATIRWKLLTGASALALTACMVSATAKAEDADHPQIWIDLSGQFNRQENGQEIDSPPFLAHEPAGFFNPRKYERPPLYGFDESAAISFQPENSDWIFSASLRYGRSSARKNAHQQTYPSAYPKYSAGGKTQPVRPNAARFIDVESAHSERHAIIDFQAGKDVGLGLFGSGTSSTVSAGIRIAQFRSRSNTTLREDPDWRFEHKYVTYPPYFTHLRVPIGQPFHSYYNNVRASRNFNGIGPSISWKNSTPIAGNENDGALTLDWSVNAALLFGRQKTRTHHQTTNRYHSAYKYGFYTSPPTRHTIYQHPATPDHTRVRNVIVPNVGGSLGISYRFADAKLSFGYKADFFFGAIDGGIDARKSENRGFNGPYASISVGLGD